MIHNILTFLLCVSVVFVEANFTWVWVSGTSSVNSLGNYGIKGIASASNYPRSRYSALTWIDSSGSFWLFGGFSFGGINDGDGILQSNGISTNNY
jgi:hypothetical protein